MSAAQIDCFSCLLIAIVSLDAQLAVKFVVRQVVIQLVPLRC
jgi:hypothetical protein